MLENEDLRRPLGGPIKVSRWPLNWTEGSCSWNLTFDPWKSSDWEPDSRRESLATRDYPSRESAHPESSLAWPDLVRLIVVVWLCITIFNNHALLPELHPWIAVGLCFQVLVSEWIMSPRTLFTSKYCTPSVRVNPVSQWILYPTYIIHLWITYPPRKYCTPIATSGCCIPYNIH